MNAFFQSLLQSFHHAWRGLRLAFRTERSFRIHLLVTLLVSTLLLILPLQTYERITILLAIAAVLVLELLNSTVERLADLLKPRLHQYVADVKDLMAGAVLIAALFAAFIGFLIFWPYVTMMFARTL